MSKADQAIIMALRCIPFVFTAYWLWNDPQSPAAKIVGLLLGMAIIIRAMRASTGDL
jgi:hypothetical protein